MGKLRVLFIGGSVPVTDASLDAVMDKLAATWIQDAQAAP
jgi:hypothetical protein